MPPLSPRSQALMVILGIHAMMTASFLFQIPPHPPLETPAFGMGPFLGAAIVVILLAMTTPAGTRARGLDILVVLLTAVSFGPQKWLDPALPLIWPSLVTVQAAALFLLADALRSFRRMAMA